VTAHPTAEWIARQITEAFPWNEAPRYLIRDRDGMYGNVVRRRSHAMCDKMNERLRTRAGALKKTLYVEGRLSVDGLACPNLSGWHLYFDVLALGAAQAEACAVWDEGIDAFRLAALDEH
jgi:hypothetical protein